MPQPHPGQEWKHGWIPLTAGAARSKNHGRKPGGGSLISRMVAEAAETHKRTQERDRQRAAESTREPDKKASATPSKAAKPKQGRKVGADSRNTPLREGDKVAITEGRNRGKTGTVAGKGKHGAIQVDVDGQSIDVSPANLRSEAGQKAARETSRAADDALRRAAGRPSASTASIPEIQDAIHSAYRKVAKPGRWASLTDIRDELDSRIPKSRVDEALRALERRPDVNIVPESNQKTLSEKDRASAVHIGGQNKHLIIFVDQP